MKKVIEHISCDTLDSMSLSFLSTKRQIDVTNECCHTYLVHRSRTTGSSITKLENSIVSENTVIEEFNPKPSLATVIHNISKKRWMSRLSVLAVFLLAATFSFSQGYTTPADLDGNGTPDYMQSGSAANISSQPDPDDICSGESSSFSVTASGTDLEYQWQVSTDAGVSFNNITAAGTSPVYSGYTGATLSLSDVPFTADDNRYRVMVIETTFVCDTTISDPATLTVRLTPGAPTGDAAQEYCVIEDMEVGDLVVNEATTIIWYDAATGGSVVANSTTLVDGTTYYATQTVASCESVSRFAVTVTLNDTNAPGGPANQSFCIENSPTVADLSASGTNNWYAAATGGAPLPLTTPLVNGTHYYATRIQGGCESSTRSDVTVTVTTVSAPTASDQTLCFGSDSTFADIAATGTNINWFSAATGGTAYALTDIVVDGATYYAEDNIGLCKSPRTAVIITLDTLIDLTCSLPASYTVNGDCEFVVPDLSAFASVTTCGPYVLTQSPPIGTILAPGYQYFEFLVTSGRADSACGRLIHILDIDLPVIATCADNDTVYADVNCGFPLADYTPELAFSDNCTSTADMTVTQTPAAGTQIYADQVVSFVVADESGNTATCSFDLKFIDNGTPPSITCPTDVVVSTDLGSCDATGVALGAASPSGACAVSVITNDAPATYPLGDTDVNWTLTAEIIPNYVAPEPPDCLPTDVFLSPLNTTGGSLIMGDDVSVINSAGSTLVTDALSYGSGTLCDGITCNESGTTAATIAITPDLGNGSDGTLSSSTTITTDKQYSDVDFAAATGTININGDLLIRSQDKFRMGVNSILNIQGDVVIHAADFFMGQNFTLNVISGSVTIICVDKMELLEGALFTAPDPNNITILSQGDIKLHNLPDVQGLFYADGHIQFKSDGLFTGMMTANSIEVQDYCTITGLYPNTCYADPFSGVPGILNNDSDPTLAIDYPENVTDDIIDYDGIDSQDSEGAGLTWSISGPDAALFNLDASTGILTFVSTPNFESAADFNVDNDYEVTITLTDTDLEIDSQDLVITVTDVVPVIDTCVQKVTVNDTEAPTLNCPANISVSVGATCDNVVNFMPPNGVDNCTGVSTVRTDITGLNSGDAFPFGVTTLSYKSTDTAGNSSVCSFTITVADTDNPFAGCQSFDIALDSLGQAAITTGMVDYLSSDNCTLDTLFIDTYDFDCADYGSNPVTLTAVDASGNSATCLASINVIDTILPVLDCPTPIIVSAAPGLCGAFVNYTVPAVWDNCSTTLIAQEETGHSSGDFYPTGVTIVGYYVDDPLTGTRVYCHFTITVNDTEAPTLTSCPSDITVDNPGGCGEVVNYTLPTAVDNCAVTSSTQIDGTGLTSGSIFHLGVTTLTYRFRDAAGNTTLCSFDITVTDLVGPEIYCPTGVSVDNDAGLCTASGVTLGTATSNIVCGVATISNDAPATYPVGDTDVTWTLETELKPAYFAETSPECLPTDVFQSPLNTTGGSLEIDENVQIFNTAGNFLTTDNMTIDPTSTCDGAACIQDGNLAQTIIITVDPGDESDGDRLVDGTISTDFQYKEIDLPEGSTLNIVGDVNLRVSEDFITGQNSTINIDGDVTIQCDFFDFKKNSQLNIISGSVTFLVESKFDVEENCVFNTDDPNNIVMLCNDVVHFHGGSSATGLFYTNGTVDVYEYCNFEGIITGFDINVDKNSTITGLYPNSCFLNPFSTDPEILNNESANSYAIAYPELATGLLMNFNGQDIQDEEYSGLTWSLSGIDAGSFTLQADSGILRFNAIPDFETPGDANGDNTYTILITLTDSDMNTDVQIVNITITDVTPVTETCVQVVTVNDTELPQIACPSNIAVSNNADECGVVVNFTAPVGTDNCPGATTAQTDGTLLVSGSVFPIGTTTLEYVVTDLALNRDTCRFDITVDDLSTPTGLAAQSFCSIDLPTIASLVTTSGSNIQWYAASTGGTPLASTVSLVNGTTYYASQTVGTCESDTRFAVTANVADPAAPTGTASQDFCSIDNNDVGDLVLNESTTIIWYDAATAGNVVAIATTLVDGTIYYASQTVGSCESDTRFAVTANVDDPAAPTGTGTQSFCTLDAPTVDDLAAIGSGIQWYANTTGGSALNGTDPVLNATTYYASQTVGLCESDTRYALAVSIGDPAAPTGDAAQSFCSIDSPDLDDIVAVGTGVIWYDAAVLGNILPGSTALITGTTYFASQNPGTCESATRLSVTVTVADPLAPTGTASQDFCSIDNNDVGDLAVNESTTIIWYTAATGGSVVPNATALVDGTIYYGSQTVGSCESDTRFAVTANVADPAAPTGTASQDFCAIDNNDVGDLLVNELTTIIWYDASSGGSVVANSTALVDGTIYYGSQTVGTCESDTRFAVTANVADPAAPTGTSSQDFCAIDNNDVGDLLVNELTTIIWYDASSGGSVVANSTALVDGTIYYGSQTVGTCESDTRFAVTANVSDPAAPTGTASQDFCSIDNNDVGDLVVNELTTIIWYTAATGGTVVPNATVLVDGTIYYASQTVGTCESDTRFAVTANVADPAAPTGIASQDFCSIDNNDVGDLTVNESTTIIWYTAATGGSVVPIATALIDGTIYYGSQTVGTCESDTRFAVTANVADPSAPTGAASQTFCASNEPTVDDISVLGTSVIWYDAAIGGNVVLGSSLLIHSRSYFASQTAGSCESDMRLEVTVDLTNPLAPVGASSQYFCLNTNPTLDEVITDAGSIQWYDAASGGNALPGNTLMTNGTTYYASRVSGTCPGIDRFELTADLDDVTLPVAVCQTDTLNVGGGTVTLNPIDVDGGSTDDCGIDYMTVAPNSFSAAGTFNVVLTVVDLAGNSAQCSVNIEVEDTDGPVAVCQDIDIYVDAAGNVSIDPIDIDGGSTDNVGIVLRDASMVDFTCLNLGQNNVTLTVEDGSGLKDDCVARVNVFDDIPPTAVCQDIVVELDASGSATITPADIDNGTSDNCDFTLSIDIDTFDCDDAMGSGEVIVTLTATDDSGNSSTCQATVTVEDNIMPDMDCTNPIVTNTDPGICGAVVNYTIPAVTDNCSSSIIAQPGTGHNPGDVFPVGVTFVGYYATNPSNGATTTCTFPITVVDNEAPVVTCPADMVFDNSTGDCGRSVTFSAPAATDNCSVTSVTQTAGPASGNTFPVGTTTITYEFSDDEGNVTPCSFDIIINDSEDPVISSCPGDITVSNDPGVCGAVVTYSAPTATDNCASMTITQTDASMLTSGDIFPVGTTTIIYTVDDGNGNSVICTFDITVNDVEDPTAVCQTVILNLGGGTATLLPSQVFDAIGSSDNCSVSPLSVTPNSFSAVGCYDVTLIVTDPAGNTDDCIVEICVEDTDDPVANCIASPLDVYLDSNGDVTVAGIDLDNGSTDNGVIVSYVASPETFDCDDLGLNSITLTVTDDGGNTASCITSVNVLDTIAPVAQCLGFLASVDANGDLVVTVAQVEGGSTDNCGIVDYAVTNNVFDCSDLGVNMVTLTVTDASGNSDACQAAINVQDLIQPTITCPSDITVPNDFEMPSAVVTVPLPVVDDNCGIASTLNDFNNTGDASGVYPIGTTVVTWIVTDVNGNSAECSMNVTVQDSSSPDPGCQADVDVDADIGACETFVNVPVPQPTDNDGIASIINDYTGTDNADGIYPVGTTVITWTVTDLTGNTSICTQSVTVNDTQDPIVSDCPPEESFTIALGECDIDSADVVLTPPVASDNCSDIFITNDAPSIYEEGVTLVTWTITDSTGNSAICEQTVNIIDSEFPGSLTCPGDIMVDNDPGICGAVVNYTTPSATDPCGVVTVTLTQGLLTGMEFPIGLTEVIYELEDINGNITLCEFSVTVTDSEDPVVLAPTDIVISASGAACEYIVTFSDPIATDNCPGVTLTQTDGTNLESGDVFPIGTTTLCYEAVDASGNSSTLCFDIEVQDVVSPVLLSCPSDVAVNADEDLCSAVVTLPEPIATDDCGLVTMTPDLTGPFDVGTTTVTWTIEDESGNTVLCIYDIIVTDTQNPVIDCPEDIDVLADYGFCDWDVVIPVPVTSDNCAIASVTNDYNGTSDASDSYPLGQTFVLWTVTDVNGNFTICTMVVNVDTPSDPVIDCPEDVTVDTDPGLCTADVTLDAPVAEVPCSIVSLTNDYNGGADASDIYPLGETIVTWTVVDISGNIGTCTQIVTVVDNEAPIIICPEDISVSNDPGLCGAVVFYPAVQVSDNCETPTVVFVSGLASGEFFEVGTTTVIYEITDQTGNISLCEFDVTVADDEAPIIICPPNIITEDSLVFYDYPSYTDNCEAELILIDGPDSGSIFDHGDTQVTFAAVDLNGNMDTCSFNVLVNTPPVGVNDTLVLVDPIGPIVIDAIDNDYDLDGDSIFVSEIIYGSTYATIDSVLIIYLNPNLECELDSIIYVVMDEHGATDTATIILDIECLELFIPDGFSPNGDGVNDVFEILGLREYPDNHLMVYNRYGHEVYNRVGYENDWDGRSEADLTVGNGTLPRGTYFYLLDLGDSDPIKGFIYINPR